LTVDPVLLQQIETAISNVGPSVGSYQSASDLFEAYAFSIVLMAARAEGANVTYRDVFGNPAQNLIFRSSPGHIYSRIRPYTHAVISFLGKDPLEAHIGVRVAGKSGVLHECDVAVIDQAEADTCRFQSVPPRSHKILIAIECKFYATTLQLGLGRAFIGLTTDMSAKKTFFVTNTSSDSVERLLTGRKRDWERNVVPASNLEVTRLTNTFQQCFRNYKIR
jgi:hypothetical protein